MGFRTDKQETSVEKFDVEIEKSVLGSILIEGEKYADVARYVDMSAFGDVVHKKIFGAMTELYSEAQPIDLVTVSEKLKKSGDLAFVGGSYFLTGLSLMLPGSSNAEHYAKLLMEKSTKRKLAEIGERIRLAALNGKTSSEVIDMGENELLALKGFGGEAVPIKDLLNAAMDKLAEGYPVYKTGFSGLDFLVGGFVPSEVMYIGARTGSGKTLVAMNMLRHLVRNGVGVLYQSIEMSFQELFNRWASSDCEIPHWRFKPEDGKTRLMDEDWPKLEKFVSRVYSSPVVIDDAAGVDVSTLRSNIRRAKKVHDVKVVFVDHMHIMKRSEYMKENEALAELTRSFKILAKEERVGLCVLAQLSRGVEYRPTKEPEISDLRGSGGIEENADSVVLIHQVGGNPRLMVKKNRHGPTGYCDLVWIKDYMKLAQAEKTLVEPYEATNQ